MFGGIDINTMNLLHFDKDFTDEMGDIWNPVNSPTIGAANAKFKNALQVANGSYLSKATPLILGGRDFTVDGWCYMSTASGDWARVFNFFTTINNDSNFVIMFARHYTASYPELFINGATTIAPTSFNIFSNLFHFALVYENAKSKVSLYLNGILSGTSSIAIAQYSFPYAYIGRSNYTTDGNTTGSISEFRISNVARWTKNFNPWKIKYYKQFGVLEDENKKLYGYK